MQDCFKIRSDSGEYSVHIGKRISEAKLGNDADRIILCDEIFAPTYQNATNRVIGIAALESSKSLEQIADVVVGLRLHNANRGSHIVAIGGGVIQDVATFVASIYMRGLQWSYCPTTLLGMVDSCIGGKSSINVGQYKNIVGNFYPPENIFIDLGFIETLDQVQLVAGLCEAVKICFAHPGDAFERYIDLNPSPTWPTADFSELISLCLTTKRWFIEIDEHDANERLLLNFGHTFGHAIEGASNFEIPHGVAVGIGMLAAISFAHLNGHFSTPPNRVALLERHIRELLAMVPSNWSHKIAAEQLMDRFLSDKKHLRDHLVLIAPNSQGHLERLKLPRSRETCDLIRSAFTSTCI